MATGFSLEPKGPLGTLSGSTLGGAATSKPAKPLLTQKLGLKNPGGFEEAMREVQKTYPHMEVWDGIKIELNRPLRASEPFATVFHGMKMDIHGGVYTFGGNWFSKGQKTILMAKLDSKGILRANAIRRWSDNFTTKLQTQLSPSGPNVLNMDATYSGDDYTVSAKVINDNVFFVNYMQSVTKRLALGVELEATSFQNAVTYGVRYVTDDWVATAKVATEGDVHLGYYHKLTPELNLATDVEYSTKTRTSVFRAGYELKTRTSRVRAMISSEGKVMSLVEEAIMPGVTFQLTGQCDYAKDSYKVGVGLTVGQ